MDQWTEIGTRTRVFYTVREMYSSNLVCISNRRTPQDAGGSSSLTVELDFSMTENGVLLRSKFDESNDSIVRVEVGPGVTIVAAVFQPLHPRVPMRLHFNARLEIPSLIDRRHPELAVARSLLIESAEPLVEDCLGEAERQSDAIDRWLNQRRKKTN